jgi:hypothetical protein
MIQHRGQAAIYLARMNRSSKQLRYYGNMQKDLVPSAISELMPDMFKWANDVYDYWLSHPEPILGNEIEKVDDVDFLRCYMGEYSHLLHSKQQVLVLEYILLVTNMKEESDKVLKESLGGNLKITRSLNELGAEKEMIEAQNAGFLDYKFQPLEDTSIVQMKTLAYALGNRINVPLRRRWILFSEQWNVSAINSAQIPNPKSESIQKILNYYKDVDFTDLFCPTDDARFKTYFSARRIKTMFTSLINLGYIDPETKEEQMLAIFGKGEFVKPINWLRELRLLAYFIDTAMAPTNKDFWTATACCFTVNGKVPNRGSLKTALGTVKSKGIYETYASDILNIAQQFNRPMRQK